MARGTTLGQLVQDLRIEAGLDPNPALSLNVVPRLEQLIRREQERLYEQFDWPFLRITRDVTLQAGDRYYDIPNDMNLERIERVDYFWGDKWYGLERGIDVNDYNIHDSDADVRQEPAARWDVKDTGSGEQVEIWPIPVTNGRLVRFTGIRKLKPLITQADRADLDDMMIVLFAAAEYLGEGKPEAQIKRQKANDRMTTLKARVIQTTTSSFNFNSSPDHNRIRDRTPQVAYVRNPI